MADLRGGSRVQGSTSHDNPDVGDPVKIGGKYRATPAAVSTDGDVTDAVFDSMGRQGVIIGQWNDASKQADIITAIGDAETGSNALKIAGFALVWDGTQWSRMRAQNAVSAAPNTAQVPDVLAVAIGPGFDVKADPSNLATAANSVVATNVDGADIAVFAIGTSTTGTITFEVTSDDTNWVQADCIQIPQSIPRQGSITPASGTRYRIMVSGYRQVRVRTVTTLGATVAVKITKTLGVPPSPNHEMVFPHVNKVAQYTTAQTGTAIWTPTSGYRIVVTYVQIQAGGTTAGTMQLWWGASGDTTYTRGTDRAVFDGEWAPSSTLKPGAIMTFPSPHLLAGGSDDILRVTDSAAINPLTVNVWGYEVPG